MSDTLTILSIVLTAIFGLSGFFFYVKSGRFTLPTFVITRTFLQTKAHPEVVILFNQKKVENLAGVRILFFNAGTKEIRAADIPNSSFPTVEFTSPSQILSHSLLASSCKEINFKVNRLTDSTLQITFDYLNPFDGGLFEVLYEIPNKSKTFPFAFKAKIIGGRKVAARTYLGSFSRKDKILFVLGVLIFLALGMALIIYPRTGREFASLIVGGIILIFVFLLAYFGITTINERRIPDFAKDFFE